MNARVSVRAIQGKHKESWYSSQMKSHYYDYLLGMLESLTTRRFGLVGAFINTRPPNSVMKSNIYVPLTSDYITTAQPSDDTQIQNTELLELLQLG